jgi:hypothetical protein
MQTTVTAPATNLPDFNNSAHSLFYSIAADRGGGVFEIRMLKGVFGSKRGKVKGKLETSPNDEVYFTPDTVRMMKSRGLRWERHIARMGPMRNACNILVVQPEKKRPLGISRRRSEDNIKLNVK